MYKIRVHQHAWVIPEKGIPKRNQAILMRCIRAAMKISPPTSRINIVLHNNCSVFSEDHGPCAGMFIHPTNARGRSLFKQASVIIVAAKPHQDNPRQKIQDWLPHVFLHEWAHYERYRACRENSEHGINRRAKNLRAQMLGER